jgi:hypothetical protein
MCPTCEVELDLGFGDDVGEVTRHDPRAIIDEFVVIVARSVRGQPQLNGCWLGNREIQFNWHEKR